MSYRFVIPSRPPGMARAESDYWDFVKRFEDFAETFEETYCKHCPCRKICDRERNLDNCIDREWELFCQIMEEEDC